MCFSCSYKEIRPTCLPRIDFLMLFPASVPEREMTKEEASEPVEGDAVRGCSTRPTPHQRAVVHQVASAPMPDDCEFSFFDPSEAQCKEILQDPNTTIPELFAVLRQWVPQVQKNIDVIGMEILRRGCGVNDRDGLTDMTLLHYCCKAGAPGIGDAETAARFACQLLALGADPNLRSRWTNMRALHYAAYFDVPQLVRLVLEASQPGEVDATCSDFDFGTALHISAFNLCSSAVRCLLELGANPAFRIGTLRFCGSTEFSGGLWAGVELDKPEGKNDGSVAGVQYFTCPLKHGIFAPVSKISKPLEKHKPRSTKTPLRPTRRADLSRVTSRINTGVLSRSLSSSSSSLDSQHGRGARPRPLPRQRLSTRQRRENISPNPRTTPSPVLRSSSRPTAAGFRSRTPSGSSSVFDGSEVRLGERVLVAGERTGVVQFCGNTNFAPGVWLGVELDKPSGKNDGSVGGVRYFSCPPKHGVFAPPSRVQRIHGSVDCLSELTTSRLSRPPSETIRRSFSTSSAIAAPKEMSRRSPVSRWDVLLGFILMGFSFGISP
uniref:CAP-Gly domain-containing linker protein 4-like n=1 Tax=Nothobranchius furzeri TaxID=105023 RepID=A0A8C6NVN0_NOTFU